MPEDLEDDLNESRLLLNEKKKLKLNRKLIAVYFLVRKASKNDSPSGRLESPSTSSDESAPSGEGVNNPTFSPNDIR